MMNIWLAKIVCKHTAPCLINVIKDGESTALYTTYNVYTVYTAYTI